jgi:23S rRNA (cytidine1920-2'-O)/16S rRNA (cytidine1409-2'-O)-methyltransferase
MVKKAKKVRLDELLLAKGLCSELDVARRLIMAGEIRSSSDHVLTKASELLPADAPVFIKTRHQYVSRGAYKLLPALDKYLPRLDGLVCLDVGASTGGFTDLMLQRGVLRAYTIDVGYGQLHSKVRNDRRVIAFERTNARNLNSHFLPEKVDVAVTDVSFISVTKILQSMVNLTKVGGWLFVLVKPQFEAKRYELENGVVRDGNVQQRCVDEVIAFANTLDLTHIDTILSPLKGPKGNQEYTLCLKNQPAK